VKSDRGSASLWLLGVGLAVVLFGTAAGLAASALTAKHRAQSAADLSALAGAMRAADGEGVACSRVAELATANGARVVDCRLDGLDLVVTVEVAVARLPGGSVRAAARAGPLRAAGLVDWLRAPARAARCAPPASRAVAWNGVRNRAGQPARERPGGGGYADRGRATSPSRPVDG